MLRNRDEEQVPVMASSFALPNQGPSTLLGAATILRDLTPVKRLEAERRNLVNMFAHDLKTPVVGMAGLIRRLLEEKTGPPAKRRTYLKSIHREMSHLEKLITSFLNFPRLDLRLLSAHKEAIAVVEECREVLTLLAPLADAKGMKLTSQFPENLPPLKVDPLLFRRVLESLLGNAIKFSPLETTVLLEVWDEDGEMRYAVKDQGPGIASEDLEHLFEFFTGAGRLRSTRASGWVWPR